MSHMVPSKCKVIFIIEGINKKIQLLFFFFWLVWGGGGIFLEPEPQMQLHSPSPVPVNMFIIECIYTTSDGSHTRFGAQLFNETLTVGFFF